MSTKKEIEQWDAHLAEQNKDLHKGIIESKKGYSQREKGRVEILSKDLCLVCKHPGYEVLFLGKNNMGTALRICKDCLKKALDLMEKESD